MASGLHLSFRSFTANSSESDFSRMKYFALGSLSSFGPSSVNDITAVRISHYNGVPYNNVGMYTNQLVIFSSIKLRP